MKDEKEFPRFWYDANLVFMWVENLEDLQFVFDQYKGHMTKDEILDKSRNAYDSLQNFGLYSEHRGDVTLRQFLTDNGVEFSG